MRKISFIALLLNLVLLFAEAQSHTNAIHLTVRLNGKVVDPPKIVTLRSKAGSFEVPVRGGVFEPPSEAMQESVLFEASISGNRISTGELNLSKFTRGGWTIVLVDKVSNDKEFESEFKDFLRQGKFKLSSTCLIAFDPEEGNSTVYLYSHCRRKVR